jgi:hypothetical protein
LKDLSPSEILVWADEHHSRTGLWPTRDSGPIPEAPGETWMAVEAALGLGRRGFKGGSSLPRFLEECRGRYNRSNPRFEVGEILAWADAWYARTGQWPVQDSGDIPGSGGINWSIVDHALRVGRGGLPRGSSLSCLLAAERGVLHRLEQPRLTMKQILAWADQHHQRTGCWPKTSSGSVARTTPEETWKNVDLALRNGNRGLPGGSSLARLLFARRAARNKQALPPLNLDDVVRWARAHWRRTGRWPTCKMGRIPGAHEETWLAVDSALRQGMRGLPGGSSLTRLLVERCGMRDRNHPPPLTIPKILAWADAYHDRTGRWPTARSGPIGEAPGETWVSVHDALYMGNRGLPGGSSLARLFAQQRGVRNEKALPPFNTAEILRWADAYFGRCRAWPTRNSGPIPEAPGETWLRVQQALHQGCRGLAGGSSLARLLAAHRGARNRLNAVPLSVEQILAWADAHHTRTGSWPACKLGPIPKAPGETWLAVDSALRQGARGLPGGSSLTRLLVEGRGIRNCNHPPPLTIHQILRWADACYTRTGKWPRVNTGPIPEAPGETWSAVSTALSAGLRGLPGGSSLSRLLRQVPRAGDAARAVECPRARGGRG